MSSLTQAFEDINARRERFEAARREPTLIRLWDGNWNLMSPIVGEYSHEFEFLAFDAGSASIQLPLDHPVAELLLDLDRWPTKSLYVTFDKDGARWSGRLVSYKVESDFRDAQYLELTMIHDYIKLKELLAWANPFLPAEIQFPKAWFWWGPAKWVVTWTILANLMRKNNSLWMLPDKPWDLGQWVDLDWSGWNMAVDMQLFRADASMPVTVHSRFKTVHETIVDACKDAQLGIELRRFLPGDPQPLKGKNLRYGCLVVRVHDKSGWSTGTAYVGSRLTGLTRVLRRVTADGMGVSEEVIKNPTVPAEYSVGGWLGSKPEMPWVVFQNHRESGLEASGFEYVPPGPSQFVSGGQSMSGVNEVIKAGIITAAGFVGSFVGQSQVGPAIEAVLEPLYSDVFMAFRAVKNHERIAQQGWDYPFEHWVDNSNMAYSLGGFVQTRKALEDTREKINVTVTLQDGAPYYVGDNNQGDFFLYDRVAVNAQGMPKDKLFVEQVTRLVYTSSDSERGWEIECGDREFRTGLSYLSDRLSSVAAGLRDLGVW